MFSQIQDRWNLIISTQASSERAIPASFFQSVVIFGIKKYIIKSSVGQSWYHKEIQILLLIALWVCTSD